MLKESLRAVVAAPFACAAAAQDMKVTIGMSG